VGNLVSNALRYTPPGGRVVLRAYPRPGAAGRAAVVVEVGDTGSGIAPEDLPYVFERFYRADKSRSRASGGSGIGLAIVKQLVEAHAGQVEVESRPGQGATFRLVLPAAPATN
jgi:two-component system sensor histidine kinase BaeS